MFQSVEMKINSVVISNGTEHALRANMMNLLYTNSETKKTILAPGCYYIDTGSMGAEDSNNGFSRRMSFFRAGPDTPGQDQGTFTSEYQYFIGG